MTYYPTLAEDIERAKVILAKGKADCSTFQPDHNGECLNCDDWADAHGTIYGADTYAAYKLLESFVTEIAAQAKGLQEFYSLFSDYDDPCQSFDQAQSIWNDLTNRERLHSDKLRAVLEANRKRALRLATALAQGDVVEGPRLAGLDLDEVITEVEEHFENCT